MKPLPLSAVRPVSVEAFVLRSPIATPVRTSFGIMHDRPAVFVRVRDADGASGWGEIWCNFPSCGAAHRASLLDTVIGPLLTARAFDSPAQAFAYLSAQTDVLAIQSGEPGPIAQTIAGVDLALWDLCARRAGQPLWRYLGGADDGVAVYASGINPDQPERTAARCVEQGYRALKLKIGFGAQRDLANLGAMRDEVGTGIGLMADANQAWSLDQACEIVPRLAGFGLGWLEEPLRADEPWDRWRMLAARTSIGLAAGENIAGVPAFDVAIAQAPLKVLQPDAAKWGGISGLWPVIAAARAAGLRYCPHYLGAGVGLLASAHLLVAAGGDGMLEIDANPNPLRTEVAPALSVVRDGFARLGSDAGIGEPPDLGRLGRFLVGHRASG